MSAPEATAFFETLLKRMAAATAIDACLIGFGKEGALLAEQLVQRLPGQHTHVRACPSGLAEGTLKLFPAMLIPLTVPIVLVEAVLWQGERAMQATHWLRTQGVTSPIELAVLADRGGRTVPVAPTYCGGEVIVAADMQLRLTIEKEGLRFTEEACVETQ